MFKVGDFVALNQEPYASFIVTRIYDNDFMAIGNFDILDGKIFNELKRGDQTRKEFFDQIIDVVTLLGGDLNEAL